MVGVLLLSLPATALAEVLDKDEKSPAKKVIDYAALGDSLAVRYTSFGPGDVGYTIGKSVHLSCASVYKFLAYC